MSEHFSVATANTFAGHMLSDSDGLEPFRRAGTDVLLLQEVLHLPNGFLQGRLDSAGYKMADYDKDSGLAIAVRQASKLKIDEDDKNSRQLHSLHSAGPLGRFAIEHEIPTAHRFRTRAMLSVFLEADNGTQACVMTTHPIIFARRMARNKQLRILGNILEMNYADVPNLILAGDMNHYPGPGEADNALAERAQLHRITTPEPTWPIYGSKHEWMARWAHRMGGPPLSFFDGYLDSMLYRGPDLAFDHVEVLKIASDHKAIIGYFELGQMATS